MPGITPNQRPATPPTSGGKAPVTAVTVAPAIPAVPTDVKLAVPGAVVPASPVTGSAPSLPGRDTYLPSTPPTPKAPEAAGPAASPPAAGMSKTKAAGIVVATDVVAGIFALLLP